MDQRFLLLDDSGTVSLRRTSMPAFWILLLGASIGFRSITVEAVMTASQCDPDDLAVALGIGCRDSGHPTRNPAATLVRTKMPSHPQPERKLLKVMRQGGLGTASAPAPRPESVSVHLHRLGCPRQS